MCTSDFAKLAALMRVKMTVTAFLPFDIAEMQNELEVTIAEIMINHMTIDYPGGEVYCVVVDNDIEDDLKKEGIDQKVSFFYHCPSTRPKETATSPELAGMKAP